MSSAAENDTTDDGADNATLDYPEGMRPDTAAVARLVEVLCDSGTPPLVALGCAALFDQGRVEESLDQIKRARDAQAKARDIATARHNRAVGAIQ